VIVDVVKQKAMTLYKLVTCNRGKNNFNNKNKAT